MSCGHLKTEFLLSRTHIHDIHTTCSVAHKWCGALNVKQTTVSPIVYYLLLIWHMLFEKGCVLRNIHVDMHIKILSLRAKEQKQY